MRNKKSYSIFFSIILIIIFFTGCTENGSNRGNAEILSVSHSPRNPNQGDVITISATVENCDGVHLAWDAPFNGSSGGQGMKNTGPGEYEAQVGPFENGTELWYMVSADDYDGSYVLSVLHGALIGEIERSFISPLSVSDVLESPTPLTPDDSIVFISANVSSNVNLTDVRLGYLLFQSNSGGGGSMEMNHVSGDTFEGHIGLEDLERGATLIYMITARDESDNIAISPIFTIEL